MILIDLKNLSKKRTEIMGIAMILVVFFHSSLDVSAIPAVDFIKSIGDVGVDCFLLVSGMGIYFSLSSDSDMWKYLMRRVKRILPAFFLVNGGWFVLVDLLINQGNFSKFMMDITSLSFWVNGQLTTWYLASLMLLQALTPAYLKIIDGRTKVNRIISVCILLLCVEVRLSPLLNKMLGHLLIFFYRIPIYLLGLSVGALIKKDQAKVRFSWISLMLIIVISVIILLMTSGIINIYVPWAFRYIAFIPFACLLSYVITLIPSNRVVVFFGLRSLEIYLLHEKILWVLSTVIHKLNSANNISIFVTNVLAVILTCIGAEILRRMLACLSDGRKKGSVNYV